ncbi:MAG: hypothetical protein QF364_07620, partial [Candidatus Poseidoniaceae archaeon]|nr:hypothetical protein [Candidatus Poseidoniaceae archaeon]
MNLAARNQPMATPTTTGSELMNTLMEENELEKEEFAVEAVLSLDEVAVEVDQYDLSNDKEDSFQFIRGSTPELSQTVEFEQQQEVELQASDAPKNPVVFDMGDQNPLDEVQEPVHSGLGNLYSPSVKSETDDDLMGSVGPINEGKTATPDLPTFSNLTQPVQQLTQPQSEAPEQIATPEIPDVSTPTQSIETPAAAQTTQLPASEATSAIVTPEIPTTSQLSTAAD